MKQKTQQNSQTHRRELFNLGTTGPPTRWFDMFPWGKKCNDRFHAFLRLPNSIGRTREPPLPSSLSGHLSPLLTLLGYLRCGVPASVFLFTSYNLSFPFRTISWNKQPLWKATRANIAPSLHVGYWLWIFCPPDSRIFMNFCKLAA